MVLDSPRFFSLSIYFKKKLLTLTMMVAAIRTNHKRRRQTYPMPQLRSLIILVAAEIASSRNTVSSFVATPRPLLLAPSLATYSTTKPPECTVHDVADLNCISQQLGYLPTNFVGVSARNADRVPVAIQTYPLFGGAPRRQIKTAASMPNTQLRMLGTPFPTLYWLTCPIISKAIANLEGQGHVQRIQQIVRECDDLTQRLWTCHAEYAENRWDSLTQIDRSVLENSDESSRIRDMLQYSGIAGTNVTRVVRTARENDGNPRRNEPASGWQPSIKCLHTHYAHFRSTTFSNQVKKPTLNPVGEMVEELLRLEFPEVLL
jgi:hypothetical protein